MDTPLATSAARSKRSETGMHPSPASITLPPVITGNLPISEVRKYLNSSPNKTSQPKQNRIMLPPLDYNEFSSSMASAPESPRTDKSNTPVQVRVESYNSWIDSYHSFSDLLINVK
jgi:hypothetical protein